MSKREPMSRLRGNTDAELLVLQEWAANQAKQADVARDKAKSKLREGKVTGLEFDLVEHHAVAASHVAIEIAHELKVRRLIPHNDGDEADGDEEQ